MLNYIYTHTHTSTVVVGEVVRARLFGNWRRGFRDGDVLQIEEAELHLHADECIQVAACQVAAHLPAQQRAQPVCPDAVLLRKTHAERLHHNKVPAPKLENAECWETQFEASLSSPRICWVRQNSGSHLDRRAQRKPVPAPPEGGKMTET